MNAYTLLPCVLALLLPAFARAESAPDFLADAEKKVFDGPFEQIVCISEGRLNVRTADLNRVALTVPNFTTVKVFQGWGENKKAKVVNGKRYQFIKVQFPAQDDATGWVADELVRPRSRCAAAPQVKPAPKPVDRDDEEEEPVTPGTPGDGAEIRGLNDPNCCQFPVKGEPTDDFAGGMRRFGAGRSGGRLHAACDLYRFVNEPISAVAPGVVIRDLYNFYQGTYALEVRHNGGFVVRYGEVTGKNAQGVSGGKKIAMGQTVGYMGKVSSNCCEPMLHFELYSGAKTGSLSTGSGPYQRRSDLLNPTAYLRKWQENAFKTRR